ncbi:Intracellular distribution of mitochondria [Conoideocrella luteorostrata]|uniref:Clustered mitochondria protein homolog n=1 Tax=Conoideocrella luteorostrata TaxID=1105319 RepID=A0AAJ0CXX6_9HYPO|nr:Intracellular distribution of mitochondria [Conoideocrella luteorostrata]
MSIEALENSTASARETPTDPTGAMPASPETGATADTEAENGTEALINLSIVFPEPGTKKMQIMISTQEQVHEVRQSIIDLPAAFRFTCFHLKYRGEKVNDYIPIAEIPGLDLEPEFHLVEDPYTEKEARIHFVRIRELIGAAGDRAEIFQGVLPGLSLYESVSRPGQSQTNPDGSEELASPLKDYDFQAESSLTNLIPETTNPAPRTVKSMALSSWNPPPCYLRQRGHLLYLVVTTTEGEQFQITSHVSGFFVNKSSNAKFDPSPRSAPKGHSAHSLLELLSLISPSFNESFQKLQEYSNLRDPLATFQITNTIPSAPWVVPCPTSTLCAHVSDPARPQETYLLAGVDNTDTLRDWNEEFQSAKELPKETVQDRVFRERLVSKLFADYNDAATKGAVMVARGEITPLNPTECRDAQIFVYNNIFFSFGSDGVGTFTSEGGDEAARVATGKDVAGVRLVNQLDIDGLFVPATVVVDYLGKRVVGQSIVPGIFKQREPGENQIDYGAVDGKDVVAADERFASSFAQLSKALKVKNHPVWDKDGKRFDLEASVETKGLMGTDGRKYVLDLYRITPYDITWLDETKPGAEGVDMAYPHRMTVLRPELVDSFARYKMKQWVDKELTQRGKPKPDEHSEDTNAISETESNDPSKPQLDLSDFKFSLNPDSFSGQTPQTDEEKTQLQVDENGVREAGDFLRRQVIPELLRELAESIVSFPMDGQSLSRLLHKRGINVRYEGIIASGATDRRIHCLREICIQDMVARAFKHVAGIYLRGLPVPFTAACLSHLLNCLLGYGLNSKPRAQIDSSLQSLYIDADMSFEKVTPKTLLASVEKQVLRRFRYKLEDNWQQTIRKTQLLREVSLKLGIQVQAKDYVFVRSDDIRFQTAGKALSNPPASQQNGELKDKKKKKTRAESPAASILTQPDVTFTPEDIVNVVPVVKHSTPRSALAEEALEAGRLSIMQNQKKLGQELLLESLSLHEQIYGILHPEVARVYNSLSMLYYQLDDKEAAVELARKAIVVAERTVGIDSAETLLNYLNLSLFLHQTGDSKGALAYCKHALMLWKIIYGPSHPDSITTINNAAVMLQHLKQYHESRLWFEESLRICESLFGRQSINSATLLFQLAQALALDHDSKGAVNRMRDSYNIFLSELGPEDKNTKEAESWLEQLTQNAVSIAKHAKDVQARRIPSGIRFPATVPPAHLPVSGSQRMAQSSPADSRSIDELIRFIEGGDQKSASSKKRPGRGNPKRRGKSAIA